MGNTCKPMAVSFQCMTKSTTNKKKKENKQTKKKKKSYFPQAIATLGTQMVPLQRYAKMIKDCREKRYLLISDKKSEVLCQL